MVEIENEIPDIKRKDIILRVKCKDCIFFKQYATYQHPCSMLGTIASAKPCSRFTLNPSSLGNIAQAAEVFAVLAPFKQKLLLAAALVTAKRVTKHGLKIGDRIYFKLSNADFISNYTSAVVVGANSEGIVVGGRENFTAILKPSSVLTLDAWKAKRKSLLSANKINDPKGLIRITIKGVKKLQMYLPQLARKISKKRGRKAKVAINAVQTKSGKRIKLS